MLRQKVNDHAKEKDSDSSVEEMEEASQHCIQEGT